EVVRIAGAREWIARRHGVIGWRLDVDVDPQLLPEHRREILAALERVAAAAAVAGAGVEIAIGSEGELTAVVVAVVLMIDRQQHLLARRVGEVEVRAHLVARDRDVAVRSRVVDEEPAVRLVVGMEREAQEPALAAARNLAADVEELLR